LFTEAGAVEDPRGEPEESVDVALPEQPPPDRLPGAQRFSLQSSRS
jgi:hypothetical protein